MSTHKSILGLLCIYLTLSLVNASSVINSFRSTVEPLDTIIDQAEQQQLFLEGQASQPLDHNQSTLSAHKIEHDPVTGMKLVENPPKATYFGVDADDHEAVRKRQRELSDEKFAELFGHEISPEDMNFEHHDESSNPILTQIKSHIQEAFDKLQAFSEALKKLGRGA